MRTKSNKQPRVNLITLGCAKNTYDSEVLMGQLSAGGKTTVHEQKTQKTDTVIINTCGFIDKAKQESIETILEFAEAKKEGKIEKLIVMGCLSERYAEDLKNEIDGVDAWFGTRDLPKILSSLDVDYKHELIGERLLSTPSHYAYLKISEGCNRPCSFCAIPLMRGKHISTPIEDLVNQAKILAKNGVKELILIAQELTFYGQDLYGKRNLSDLLKHLSDVPGIEWIRLQYAYPAGFPLDILDTINERENICKYLDMPLQHASDNVLKLMRRGITREKTIELINEIKHRVPNIALRTTMLVGHPGETEEDFNNLLDFVKLVKFDRLGVFTYSNEENTHAGSMSDDLDEEVKEERKEILMETQKEISMELNAKKIGKTYKVLVDRVEGDYYVGRTEFDSPEVDNEVLIKSKPDLYLRLGDFTQVKIYDALEYDLFGEVIS
jgi:ribosomal protein S12 methylthiotransferase